MERSPILVTEQGDGILGHQPSHPGYFPVEVGHQVLGIDGFDRDQSILKFRQQYFLA